MGNARPSCPAEYRVITPELDIRPARTRDQGQENAALASLVQDMAAGAPNVLQHICDQTLHLTKCRSAGISQVQAGGPQPLVIGRIATAGAPVPDADNHCAAAMAQQHSMLLSMTGAPASSPGAGGIAAAEQLLVPFRIGEGAVGMLWAIKHSQEDRFDRADARLMTTLSHLASILCQQTGAMADHGIVSSRLATTERQHVVLVTELQHHVRNMLSIVRSVFARTVAAEGELEELVSHFSGRLDALARTQMIVTQSRPEGVDLEGLVRDELMSVGASEGPLLTIAGPAVGLSDKVAEAMGLAMHELTTNAIKFGALRMGGARLDIYWNIVAVPGRGDHLELYWTERGVPAIPVQPVHRGFGSELIEEALPYQIGATTRLDVRGGGVRCFIGVPLEQA